MYICLKHLKKYGWVVSLISLIIAILAIPAVYNYVYGYDLRIELKEELRKGNVVVEISNEGGYPLHDVSGSLSFSCHDADYYHTGENRLEGYIDTLNKEETNVLLFKDEVLTTWVDRAKYSCSDMMLELTYYEDLNDLNLVKLTKKQVFEWNKEKDTLKETEIKQGGVYITYQCTYCSVNTTIHTSEKNFSQIENFTFSGVEQQFRFAGDIVSRDSSIIGLNVGTYDESCFIGETPCYKHVCRKIREEFGAPIDCGSTMFAHVPRKWGSNLFTCKIINDKMQCFVIE